MTRASFHRVKFSMSEILPTILLCFSLITLSSSEESSIHFSVATVGEKEFCVAYRTSSWTKHRFVTSTTRIFHEVEVFRAS